MIGDERPTSDLVARRIEGWRRWFDDVAAAEAALTEEPWSWRFDIDSTRDPAGGWLCDLPADPLILRSFEVEILFRGERVFWLRGKPDTTSESYAFVDVEKLRTMVALLNVASVSALVLPPGVG